MYRDKYIFFFMCRVAELRGARAPCPDLLEKNFSPKPLFVGFMAISVSGYYGDFISVGTGGY